MVVLIWLGALMIILSVLYMVYETLWGRRLSDPPQSQRGADDSTLEPRGQDLRFLGFRRTWPSAVLFVLGLGLLFVGAAG